MFGNLIDTVADITIDATGSIVETVTFGAVDKKTAKELLDDGYAIAKIAHKMDISEDDVRQLLK